MTIGKGRAGTNQSMYISCVPGKLEDKQTCSQQEGALKVFEVGNIQSCYYSSVELYTVVDGLESQNLDVPRKIIPRGKAQPINGHWIQIGALN